MKLFPLTVIATAWAFCFSTLMAQSVSFEPLATKGVEEGKVSSSSCVLIDSHGTLVTVAELGSDVNKATLVVEGKKVSLKFIANDQDSRVAIYRVPSDYLSLLPPASDLGSSHDLKPSEVVYASATERADPARVVCRVNRFQGKVLPLAVLRVNHSKSPPSPGSGIFNSHGKLVGLVRQVVYNSKNSSYCLPVEVITRSLEDYQSNKRISRCWIGIIMDQLVAAPVIESIRPGSPASKAGLQKGDVILSIGTQNVSGYAQVADALYYLVAGAPKKFRVIRGTEVKEFDVIPEIVPGS